MPLPIEKSIETMHRLCPNAQFWNNTPHSEWFPPTPVDLLETILNVNIPERVKREVVVQYVIYWLRATGRASEGAEDVAEIQNPDRFLAVETIKVMTNQMLGVDLEKIYYVLDQEREALRPVIRTDNRLSVEEEEITWANLWAGRVGSIGKTDLERFEKRMKMQLERGKSSCES